jgi:cell cycle checkpoint control protein RAD9A
MDGSFVDTSDGALHTKLWIDPAEELVEYSHTGAAVDVTFSVKELKAFIAFCEGAEADMHMYFDKAGVPLLVAPRFGLDDAAHSDFDATLILATLMDSQLHSDESAGATHHAAISAGEPAISNQSGSRGHAHTNASTRRVNGSSASTPRSDQTAIWSELSGL